MENEMRKREQKRKNILIKGVEMKEEMRRKAMEEVLRDIEE